MITVEKSQFMNIDRRNRGIAPVPSAPHSTRAAARSGIWFLSVMILLNIFAEVSVTVLVILAIIALLLPIIALIDIVKNDFSGANKVIWVVVVLFLPILGSILYFLIGRNHKINTWPSEVIPVQGGLALFRLLYLNWITKWRPMNRQMNERTNIELNTNEFEDSHPTKFFWRS